MKNQNMPPTGGPKHGNDPRKNDPTKQDERDNDATRIRPEKEKKEHPEEPPANPSTNPGSKGIEEEQGELYKKSPGEKQEPINEPAKEQSVDKSYNPASQVNRKDEATERDDSGNPVMKKFGKGL